MPKPTNGAPESQAPQKQIGVSPVDRVDRTALLAGLDAELKGAPKAPAATKPPKETPPDDSHTGDDPDALPPEDDGDDQGEGGEEGEGDPGGEDEGGAGEEDLGGEGKAAQIDPEAQKRLAGVQRQEQRFRERMERDKAAHAKTVADFQAQVREWEPRIRAVQDFEALKKRARYAPDDVLLALGLTEDDFEAAAKTLYARSQAGAKDPKYKAAAVQTQREREKDARIASLEEKIDKLLSGQAQREEAATSEAEISAYVDRTVKAIGDGAPLVAAMMKKDAKKTRERLRAIGDRLADEIQGVPDPAEVVEALETERREQIEGDGWTVEEWLERQAARAAPPAGGGKPPRQLGKAGGGAGAGSRKPRSRDEEFDDLRAEITSGKPLPAMTGQR